MKIKSNTHKNGNSKSYDAVINLAFKQKSEKNIVNSLR